MPSWSSVAVAALLLFVVAHEGHRRATFRDFVSCEPCAPPEGGAPNEDAARPSVTAAGAAKRREEESGPLARSVVGLIRSADAEVTAALVEGATRAFDEARAAGGPDLALVVGNSTSAWSSVAAEAVRLACDERVVALVAPPERALAHPVAQAATRCRVPVLSTSRAASVTAAGSKYVLSVAPTFASEDDPASRPRPEWAAAGYDAARVIVGGVRRAGLSRSAMLAAIMDGTAVTGSPGALRFSSSGRREPASK